VPVGALKVRAKGNRGDIDIPFGWRAHRFGLPHIPRPDAVVPAPRDDDRSAVDRAEGNRGDHGLRFERRADLFAGPRIQKPDGPITAPRGYDRPAVDRAKGDRGDVAGMTFKRRADRCAGPVETAPCADENLRSILPMSATNRSISTETSCPISILSNAGALAKR
jgi:hypothetical protein